MNLLNHWEQLLTNHLLLALGSEGGQLVDTINLILEIPDSFVGLGLILNYQVLQLLYLLLCSSADLFNLGLQLIFQGGREGG